VSRPDDPQGIERLLFPAIGLAVAVLFFLSFGSFLNPFLGFLVLVGVLWPFRGNPHHTALLSVGACLTFLWILATTGSLLAPFVLALVLAYMLDPLVDRMSAGRLSRSAAILLLALPLVAATAALLFLGLPAGVRQMGELLEQLPALLDRITEWAAQWEQQLLALNLPWVDEVRVVEQLRAVDSERLFEIARSRFQGVVGGVWSGVIGVGRGLGTFLTLLSYAVLTPVLTFYLLRDYDHFNAKLLELIPPGRREEVVSFAADYDRDLSAYLRGQFTVALIVGSITAVGLAVWGFPYAFLIGGVVAVLGLIPYAGLLLSLIPAVAIALLSGDVTYSLVQVAVVFGVAQALEGTVISPRIVGESVGLHPVWIVLSLSVGGFFLGFLGLLIGVPLAVGLKLVIGRIVSRYKSSVVYRGEPAIHVETE